MVWMGRHPLHIRCTSPVHAARPLDAAGRGRTRQDAAGAYRSLHGVERRQDGCSVQGCGRCESACVAIYGPWVLGWAWLSECWVGLLAAMRAGSYACAWAVVAVLALRAKPS